LLSKLRPFKKANLDKSDEKEVLKMKKLFALMGIVCFVLILQGLPLVTDQANSAPKPAPTTSAPASVPPTSAPASTTLAAGQVSQQAIQALYTAAKAEGSVLWQTIPVDPTQLQPLINAFQQKYPGIKISPFALSSADVITRVITESGTGSLGEDIVWSTATYFLPLFSRDLVVSYDWQSVSDVSPSNTLFNNRYIHLYDSVPVIIYNTKMVPAADAPKSFQDLLNPKWQGKKIAITNTGQVASFLVRQWQQDKQGVLTQLDQLAKQQPFMVRTIPDAAQRVASGEVPIGYTFYEQVRVVLRNSAPVAICPVTPSYGAPNGMGIPKNSPHPNAAKLFLGWLSSRDARPYWLQTPFNSWTEGAQGQALKAAGVQFVSLDTQKDINDLNDVMAATVKALTLAK
jgi:iron(III) transport system substrate-binding protein